MVQFESCLLKKLFFWLPFHKDRLIILIRIDGDEIESYLEKKSSGEFYLKSGCDDELFSLHLIEINREIERLNLGGEIFPLGHIYSTRTEF